MAQLKGEGLKVGCDSSLRLEFHGSKVTSDHRGGSQQEAICLNPVSN